MASSIRSSDHRFSMSKRRSKPLSLTDYLLDDLSSCSSNGFKSFPRRLLDAEIKRSVILHPKRRPTYGAAFSHAAQKVSTALLSAVKLLPFLSSSVISQSPSRIKGSLSRNLWKKLSHRELNNGHDGEVERETAEQKIRRGTTFGDFLKESLDRPSDQASHVSGEVTLSNSTGGGSTSTSVSVGSELFTNLEVTQSSGESEKSKENDAVRDEVEERTSAAVVITSGDCVGPHVSERSSVNDNNRKECVNEEKEQLSPISILECPFQDDAVTPHSHQKETDEKKILRKSRRFESLERLESVNLEKRIEQYVGGQYYGSHCMVEIEEDQSEKRANRLFALVKSRLIEKPSHYLLVSQKVDNLLLDFFKEGGDNETRDEDKLVKIVEEWVMRRQEEEYMFMSWEVEEKRESFM